MPARPGNNRHRASERAIHLNARALDPPRPVLSFRAQTSHDRILPNVIDLGRELFAALIVSQSMVEIPLLPDDSVPVRLEMLPSANGSAHGFIPLERQQRAEMIGHQEECRGVPAIL